MRCVTRGGCAAHADVVRPPRRCGSIDRTKPPATLTIDRLVGDRRVGEAKGSVLALLLAPEEPLHGAPHPLGRLACRLHAALSQGREATTASRGTPMKVANALLAGASSSPEIVSLPGAISRPLLTSDCRSRSRVPF